MSGADGRDLEALPQFPLTQFHRRGNGRDFRNKGDFRHRSRVRSWGQLSTPGWSARGNRPDPRAPGVPEEAPGEELRGAGVAQGAPRAPSRCRDPSPVPGALPRAGTLSRCRDLSLVLRPLPDFGSPPLRWDPFVVLGPLPDFGTPPQSWDQFPVLLGPLPLFWDPSR